MPPNAAQRRPTPPNAAQRRLVLPNAFLGLLLIKGGGDIQLQRAVPYNLISWCLYPAAHFRPMPPNAAQCHPMLLCHGFVTFELTPAQKPFLTQQKHGGENKNKNKKTRKQEQESITSCCCVRLCSAGAESVLRTLTLCYGYRLRSTGADFVLHVLT